MLIDTHAHILILSENNDEIFNRVIDGISNKQPGFVIETGTRIEDAYRIDSLIKEHENIYGTIGIHPIYAQDAKEGDLQKIADLAKNNKKILAIGEIGFDYFRNYENHELQKPVLNDQIVMADELGLPITLHVREAYKDCLDTLNEMKKHIKNGIYLHCYSGSKELVSEFKKFDAYFGFNGVITFKNAKKDEIVREVGLDRIFSETDCPYLTPEPLRGQSNYPEYVKYVAEKLSKIFDVGVEEVEKRILQNALNFFKRL